MKVLFIGGTGIISSASSELALSRGIELYHLNRGKSASVRSVEGVKNIIADIRNPEETKKTLEPYNFDVVVEWIAFEPKHILTDYELFKNKTTQYVFISSASGYQTPPLKLPITEGTPMENQFWEYSQKKIACEALLKKLNNENGFNYTIVRPSHTYDKTLIPLIGGFTALSRIKKNKPIVIQGDGTSIWTLTHHKDFAVGLVGILGNKKAYNEAFHITNNELLNWNQIANELAKALKTHPHIVHVPSEVIATYNKEIGDGLLGDKMYSMIFDNTKIKSVVPDFDPKTPFAEGAKEIVAWYESNPELYTVDKGINDLIDQIINDHKPSHR